jgi:hypothetical protein
MRNRDEIVFGTDNHAAQKESGKDLMQSYRSRGRSNSNPAKKTTNENLNFINQREETDSGSDDENQVV